MMACKEHKIGFPEGVSVVICTYNGSSRIMATLEHLFLQEVDRNINWEIVVIDNASSDRTGSVVEEWASKRNMPCPLRVIYEPRAGLTNARKRGVAESRYSTVSFVDDDNWVCAGWISGVMRIFLEHPEVGACGGPCEAVCETSPPMWFARFKGGYAVEESMIAREVNGPGDNGYLCGAGLSIRKSAWEALFDAGFELRLSDRLGGRLISGGDAEICFGLRLLGWRLWYDPTLRLKHFIPASRLTWRYLRRLHRGFGMSRPYIDPYSAVLTGGVPVRISGVKRSWLWNAMRCIKVLAAHYRTLAKLIFSPLEGRAEVLVVESQLGALIAFLRLRKTLTIAFKPERSPT